MHRRRTASPKTTHFLAAHTRVGYMRKWHFPLGWGRGGLSTDEIEECRTMSLSNSTSQNDDKCAKKILVSMGYASLTHKTIGINVLRNYWLNGVFVRRQLITSPSTYLVASRFLV